MPRKVFTAGEVLAAADVNSFLMNQAVMTFADSAARGSAIGTAVEGMLVYLADTNTYQTWNGTAWQNVITGTHATVTTAYTASAANAGGFIYSTSSSAITVTIPDVFQVGDRIDIIRDGAGTVTIAAGTGVTANGFETVSITATGGAFSLDATQMSGITDITNSGSTGADVTVTGLTGKVAVNLTGANASTTITHAAAAVVFQAAELAYRRPGGEGAERGRGRLTASAGSLRLRGARRSVIFPNIL
jgi:hypothetical protein